MKNLLEKLSRSRDLAISVLVHLIIVLVLALAVVRVVHETEPEEKTPGVSLLEAVPAPPKDPTPQPNLADAVKPQPAAGDTAPLVDVIKTMNQSQPWKYQPVGQQNVLPPTSELPAPPVPVNLPSVNGIPREAVAGIQETAKSWKLGNDTYHFTAMLAQYKDGDWNTTVRIQNQRVTGGSLPNLLYLMNKWSKDRIQTNEDKVEVVRLDSDAILTKRPPFIFMTGTRDFKLTDAEVENLRKYLRLGGCVWGDSSVPGLRSPFDLAFKREMKRVIGNIDAEFEPLPENHRLFREAYFKQVTSVPPGLNYYREPVQAIKMFGEVAIIYTANDYGDMWQIGLNAKGEVDFRKNQHGQYLAINPELWELRSTYVGNVIPVGKGREPAANLADTYRFGANVIFHLLTRWDEKLASAGAL